MTTLRNSQRIRQTIELGLPDFTDASTELATHPQFRDLYPELLVRLHQTLRAATDIMTTAENRCLELAVNDPVAARFAKYLHQHIQEEMHHDEWALEDLELIGVKRADVLRRMPSPAVAACVGARFYWIKHHHPVAEVGALAVLEGYPPTIDVIDMMQETTGWPRAAFRTLERHAHLDAHHRDELIEVMDDLPLTNWHHEIIATTALHVMDTASTFYREIVEQAEASAGEDEAMHPNAA